MIIRDLLDLVNKENRRKERVKATQRFAVGIGVVAAMGVATGIFFAPKSGKEMRSDMKEKAVSTVGTIKESVQKKSETVKDSATQFAQEISNRIKDVHGKREDIKKEIKDGFEEIRDDANKTAENISDELKKL